MRDVIYTAILFWKCSFLHKTLCWCILNKWILMIPLVQNTNMARSVFCRLWGLCESALLDGFSYFLFPSTNSERLKCFPREREDGRGGDRGSKQFSFSPCNFTNFLLRYTHEWKIILLRQCAVLHFQSNTILSFWVDFVYIKLNNQTNIAQASFTVGWTIRQKIFTANLQFRHFCKF